MVLIAENNHTGKRVIIAASICGTFAVVVVGLRFWARKHKKNRVDSSDWTCLAALITSLALIGSTVNTVVQGLGLPASEVSYGKLQNFAKGMLAGIFLWTAAVTLVRISMILFYIKIFRQRPFMILSWLCIGLNIANLLSTYVVALSICRPLAFNWDPLHVRGHCGNQKAFYLSNGFINLFLDVSVILMPMPLLWNLKLPMMKKISLTFVFGMGLGICIVTLIRTVEVARTSTTNTTYDYASVGVLSVMEPVFGVINCSLPLLRPVSKKLMVFFGNKEGTSQSNPSRPSFLQSIGSNRTRAKLRDPYALNTLDTHKTYRTEICQSHIAEEGESKTNLVFQDEAIKVQRGWDVQYSQTK
ncbi:hypothetical protein P154DRAFT_478525 [Amniculicola lignicola CBS 123094]|uniref:Rhodopsin domain-containing protein n=1 Tax=Amniculicola lignicola CBS 123094 TaxID=1392246 RepID=A0A6A5W0W3_9PLEO|nr:hypothetical protein P154DRAFT_478525 [Amniculicola lignicola CBS 123094]